MGSTSVASVAASGVLLAASGVVCDSSLFSIGNRRKHKTTDIWRCANEDQCVPDKTGCSCRTITRGVRLARQGCWCCACRSSSPVTRVVLPNNLLESLATLTLGSSKINQHCWRFHGFGVIAAPQIIGLISFCTGMHHEYFSEVVNVLSSSTFMFENTENKQLIDG